MAQETLITFETYLKKGKVFEIPNYQRGYVWGKKRSGDETDSVTYFLKSLVDGFNTGSDLFIQGITVSEKEDKIVVIDGQQRTTLLYLIMAWLGGRDNFTIHYTVRKESNKFLDELKGLSRGEMVAKCADNLAEKWQDLYYFKKSVRIINEKLKDIDLERLRIYLLKHVKFLYIGIKEANPTMIFTMMNGNKADMSPEEVIKADLLRLVSIPRDGANDDEATRWDTNATRSKYAREWDKWLHWWNHPDVRAFYGTKNVMGLLIRAFYGQKAKSDAKLSYQAFKETFLNNGNNVKAAKDTFYELRQLQKRFEDAFNDPGLHNKVGAILCMQGYANPFIQSYFIKGEIDNLDEYLALTYLGVNHQDIVSKDQEKKRDAVLAQFDASLQTLSNDNLYNDDNKEAAFRQLLRRNVAVHSGLTQLFDFSIWKHRSLEHIYPKSRENELGYFGEEGGVHCIGNLVLLHKNDNSSFNASDFNRKKELFFDLERKNVPSLGLLHTISKFASAEWGVAEIQKSKADFINEFKNHYKPYYDNGNI